MRFIPTIVCAALVLAAVPAQAAHPATTEISVSGTGTVTSAPDIATVDAAVETYAANANDAVSQNNEAYNRIVAALTSASVARDDISLSYYNVSYNPPPKDAPPVAGSRYGFTVSRGFSVKVRDITHAGTVVDACTRSGATSINGVSFGLSDSTAARAQAVTKAVADARMKAYALAQAAHVHIVSIESLSLDGSSGIRPLPMMKTADVYAAAPTQFDQSNVSVTVTVQAVFIAQP
jgi:uncharacterized protein